MAYIGDMAKRRDIYHSDIFDFIDHGKFFVIVGEDDRSYYGIFFINSKVNDFILRHPKLRDLQIGIDCQEYTFLKYNSYIDCSTLHKINKVVLDNSIVIGQSQKRGKISAELMDEILSKVRASSVFGKDILDSFFK